MLSYSCLYTVLHQMQSLSHITHAFHQRLLIALSNCCILMAVSHKQRLFCAFVTHTRVRYYQSISDDVDIPHYSTCTHCTVSFLQGWTFSCTPRRANLLLRCFQSKNVESLISAFKVYVRPIIEYCSVVWNPCLLKDIKTIETVQRKFIFYFLAMLCVIFWFCSSCMHIVSGLLALMLLLYTGWAKKSRTIFESM